ncbi:hypothetical protein K7I13_01195 [Brucepastera parasyntrophica]|uniref:hypothetical protein n=1 Tax=Brucepastera parasyntrophica TaxID=2880008 RepID=UPI00210D2E47|nr:hypothetical protein [Brucepastera parasyntrophica]ULQ59985.1 hypothetical protein K7I13_01195 [Brucepastera parasyntrophica]
MNENNAFAYSFDTDEAKELLRVLRKQEEVIAPNLEFFFGCLENYIYQLMTIEEAEDFFNEK